MRGVIKVCSGWILVTALVLPPTWIVVQAETIQLSIQGVPQKGAKLCWAAVSEMVVNHFDSTADGVTQGQLAAYNRTQRLTPQAIAIGNSDPRFRNLVQRCINNPVPDCDRRGNPLLPGLRFKSTSNGAALRKERLAEEIRANKPILVQWFFAPDVASGARIFGHQVIVVGIDNDANDVLIWDPWPYDLNAPDADDVRLKWFTYEEYVDPGLVMGESVSHLSEIFDLRLDNTAPIDLDAAQSALLPSPMRLVNATESTPPFVRLVNAAEATPSPMQIPSLGLRTLPSSSPVRTVPFAEAIVRTSDLSRRARALRPKPHIRGRAPEQTARVADTPMPIVALSPDDLRSGPLDLNSLLRPVTAAVLYPVLVRQQVVDAYLATVGPDGWSEHGYASTEVARRLVQQRRTLAGDPTSFYVVAVPAWATFFVAQGFGEAARLTPIATTPFARSGKTVSAREVLERIAVDIRADTDD